MSQYGGDVTQISKWFSGSLFNISKLSPLIISILSSTPTRCLAILQKSSDKSIPVALHPRFWAATVVEPIPLNGSNTHEFALENVRISFSHNDTG